MKMKKNQTSKTNGRENFLCPFTDIYITQDSNVGTHKGTKAYDIRGAKKGVRYPYYAPCTCKLLWRDVSNGQGMWQSTKKVNFANGRVDYATFVTCHDDTFDAKVGQVLPQGHQLGNMGNKAGGGANSTGVHCHIEIAQAKYTIKNWHKNKYGIWCFPKEYSLEQSCFMNDTKIIKGLNKKWVYLKTTTYKKTTDNLHMRKKPNLSGKIILTIPKGKKVEFLENAGVYNGYTWAKVKYDKKTGYVASKYLT